MNKDIVPRFVLLAIYDGVPSYVETRYNIINNITIMADGGGIFTLNTDSYPNRYPDIGDYDRDWVKCFAEYVSKWFWRKHPMQHGHEFFVARVEINHDNFIEIIWGSR